MKSSGLIFSAMPNVVGDEPFAKGRKRTVIKRRSDSMHQVEVKMEVMNCDQAKTENFFRFDQVADISAGKVPASGTGTLFFNRAFVETVGGVLQVDCSDFGECGTDPK